MANDLLQGIQTAIAMQVRSYMKKIKTSSAEKCLRGLARDWGVAYNDLYQMWVGDFNGRLGTLTKVCVKMKVNIEINFK